MLKGQKALVTGAGRGIGRAIAIALANQGAALALSARSVEQLDETRARIEELGGKAVVAPADLSDPTSISAMISAAEDQNGPLDLLVNNAASVGALGPTWESDPADWWRCLEVNLRGPFLASHAVLPGMIARRSGRIINLASGAGARVVPYMNPYALSKTAVMRFSEALAMEAEPYGVRVFALDPGLVRTALVAGALEQPAADEWMPWFREMVASERVVPPEAAAQLAVRLASGEADALTGRFVSVYHDLDRMLAEADTVKKDGLYRLRVGSLPES